MKNTRISSFLEKSLSVVFLLVFLVFAVFFTISNQEETKSGFNQKKIERTKLLAREIIDLLERNVDVSSKLSNTLSENSIAYAVVQQNDGSILAKSEGYGIPAGIFENAESEARKSPRITLIPFKDPSGLLLFVESAMPIYTSDNNKYILRLGFFRNEEEEQLSYLRFRNILVFTLVFIFFLSILSVKYLVRISIRYAFMGSSTLVMLILFFAGAHIIRNWYGPFWQKSYVEKQCINLSKMLIPSSIKLIDEESSEDFEKYTKILEENNNFAMSALIKDDAYIYHTDAEKIGKAVENDAYRKSLNSDKASVFKNNVDGIFYVAIPIMRGDSRIGTIFSAWLDDFGVQYFVPLRDKLTLLFVFSYVVLCWFMNLYSTELEERISTLVGTGSSSKHKLEQTSSNSLQKAGYDGEKLSTSVFIFFSGIDEAITKLNNEAVEESVCKCKRIANDSLSKAGSYSLKVLANGILIVFYGSDEQDSAYRAIRFVENFNTSMSEVSFCFSPKITLHICKLLTLSEEDGKLDFIGGCQIDYNTVSKAQANYEIICSGELYSYLKDVASFDYFEVLSPVCGKLKVYAFNRFIESEELEKKYINSIDWTKLMILRILKDDENFVCKEYDKWAETQNSDIKDRLSAYFNKNLVRS